MTWSNLSKRTGAAVAALAPATAGAWGAEWQLNMPRGVTPMSHEIYELHMMILWVCVAIGVVVFGVMIYSLYAHRKSRGHEPAQFHESMPVEIAWTIVPFLILLAVTIPTAGTLIAVEDSSNPDLTIKVTGYQWLWHYKYLGENVAFYSRLSDSSNRARILNSDIDPESVYHYLRAVDRRVVVPVDKKVRLLLTSEDVIHSWWVPKLGGKKDAIPGYINDMWFRALETGIYRGQCAELCGRGHAYMPIVVQVVSQQKYETWLDLMRQGKRDKVYALLHGDDAEVKAVSGDSSEGEAAMREQASAGTGAAAGASVAAAVDAPGTGSSKGKAGDSAATGTGGGKMSKAELMALGEKVYNRRCATCHQVDGKGLPAAGFPPIKGSPVATGPLAAHIDIVLHGKNVMPAFGGILTNKQLAAVITYERNAFGNNTGDVVQPGEIEARR